MSLALKDRTVERVHLIDDDPTVRGMYKYSVEDLDLSVDEISGPIASFAALLDLFDQSRDAVICDLNLKTKNYSADNGDVIVSSLYRRRIPALLCTRWAGHLSDEVRYRRREIPVVLNPTDLSPEAIANAFQICAQEFTGVFSRERRPWRTLIRVESGERAGAGHHRLDVVIPAWDPEVALSFVVPSDGSSAIAEICGRVSEGQTIRVFGNVNLGAASPDDIYIDSWALQ